MTPLAEKIAARISASGPITLADFMADCLLDPDHGYYTTRDPLGAAGDFTTAPEISQMFGELVGLCLAQNWLDQGAPKAFSLVELGPGRGTLMADILRATAKVPGFLEAASVFLVEQSPHLRDIQSATIAHPHTHLSALSTDGQLPDQPVFLVANEFFDALPIRQFQRDGSSWRERLIGLSKTQDLTFGLSEPVQPIALEHRLADTKDGDIVETCEAGLSVVETLARLIGAEGGMALIFDYGDWVSQGDTFQAVAAHEQVDPLANPGGADLTAHVDFEAIAKAAPHLQATPLTPQGVFLERLGITARAEALARNLSGDALTQHIAAHRRLTHPDEMGTLFKAMALYAKDSPPPPGFDPA